jgi:hypothetical protein
MRVPLKGLGDAGWIPDQSAFELPPNAITDLQNFRVRAGWAERVKGWRQVFDSLPGPAYFLGPYATAATRYIVSATEDQVYADDQALGRTTITPSGGISRVISNLWTSAVMNGILGINNGTDAPMYWPGTGVLDTLPGWDATHRAKALCALKYHWVALNITKGSTQYPHRVKISAAAQPGDPGSDWDNTDPTNDAYEVDVQGDGVLVWALPLGDGLLLYKDESMALLRYTGNTEEPWSIQPLSIPMGMLAPNCGVVVPGVGHVVLTRDDAIAHDGNSFRSILDDTAKQWLQENMDPDHYARSYVVADYSKSEVQICIPERGEDQCTKAILWNWRTGLLGLRDLPNTTCGCTASFVYATENFDNDSALFDAESTITFNTSDEVFAAHESKVLMCGTDMKVFVMDSTDTQDGASFTGYVEFGALCNLVPDLKGRQILLSELWMDVDAAVGTVISVSFGAASQPSSDPTYSTAFAYTAGTDRKAEAFACGPYPAIKLSSTGWFRVRAFAPELSDEGEY